MKSLSNLQGSFKLKLNIDRNKDRNIYKIIAHLINHVTLLCLGSTRCDIHIKRQSFENLAQTGQGCLQLYDLLQGHPSDSDIHIQGC